jgi:hypothetical protein
MAFNTSPRFGGARSAEGRVRGLSDFLLKMRLRSISYALTKSLAVRVHGFHSDCL